MMKKILPILLVLVLCTSMMTLTVFAAETGAMAVTDAEVAAGSSATITVSLTSNPGVMAYTVKPTVPEGFSIQMESAGMEGIWTIGKNAQFDTGSDSTYTGPILTVTVTADASVKPGTYSISFSTMGANWNEEDVDFGTCTATITVPCDHDMQKTADQIDATCTTAGKTAVYTCANDCGKTEGGEEIPALGHSWDEGKVTQEATCKEAGVKTYTCAACQETKTEEIPATGEHSYTWVKEDETNHKGTCSCGDTKTEAHTWNDGEVTTQPTCDAAGEKTYTCTVCDATKAEEIPATGEHDHTDEYKDNEDGKTHTAYCACGDAKTEDHDYSINGEVTVAPTKTSEGEQEMLCVCGAKTVKTLPKVSADLDDVPKTGDITPHIVLTITAVMALFAAAFVWGRKFAK